MPRSPTPGGYPGSRRRRQPERGEQRAIVQLIGVLGGRAWVLGTTRRRGSACPTCGTFVPEYAGTMQTPGVVDVIGFLPPPRRPDGAPAEGPWVEVMVEAKAPGGRLRRATQPGAPDQVLFRDCCLRAQVEHVVGGFDAFLAWAIDHGYLRRDQVAHYRLPHEVST